MLVCLLLTPLLPPRRHAGKQPAQPAACSAAGRAVSGHAALSLPGPHSPPPHTSHLAGAASAPGLLAEPAACRGLATSTEAPPQQQPQQAPDKPLPLKAALRSLFKRVHPDLFAGTAPGEADARAENERSFKLLQEYLAAARGEGSSGAGPAARTAYRLVFYLRTGGA